MAWGELDAEAVVIEAAHLSLYRAFGLTETQRKRGWPGSIRTHLVSARA